MADQSSLKPTNKVTAGVLAGSLTAIGTWASNRFYGVEIPPEVAVAISVIITFCVQWIVPNAET